jgi:hypothetical protein
VVVVFATAAVLAINIAATNVDRDPIRETIAESVESKALILSKQDLEMNVRVGPHQFNDCLVLNMITDERGSRMERAMSPIHGFSDGHSPCEVLMNPPDAPADPLKDNYHRYMHGAVAVDTFLVSLFGVEKLRDLFAATLVMALCGLVIVGAWMRARAFARGDAVAANKAGVVAVTGVGMLLFYGVEPFGLTLSHPPTDLLLGIYLWAGLLLDFRKLSTAAWVGLHALFGVLTMWFELLHGGLPMGVCLIFLVWSAYASGADNRAVVWRGIGSVVSFGAAALAALAIKMAVTIAIFGPDVMGSFSDSLAERMVPASIISLAQAIVTNAHYVGLGSRVLGVLLISASVVVFAIAAFSWWKRARAGVSEGLDSAILAGLAFLSIVGWFVLFIPHSTQHAFFMVRICAGLIIAAIVLAFFTWPGHLAGAFVKPSRG